MTNAKYNSKVAGLKNLQRDAFDRTIMRERESLPEPPYVFITGACHYTAASLCTKLLYYRIKC